MSARICERVLPAPADRSAPAVEPALGGPGQAARVHRGQDPQTGHAAVRGGGNVGVAGTCPHTSDRRN
jgi:hypothetical protein